MLKIFGCQGRGPDHVVYLTVHESELPADGATAQRRPGLHIERPAVPDTAVPRLACRGGGELVPNPLLGLPRGENPPYDWWYGDSRRARFRELCWGMGSCGRDGAGLPVDGIYIASNLAGTSRVWDCVLGDELRAAACDRHGGCEELRSLLEESCESRLLDAGELCWLTDRTPHESLPLPETAAAAAGGKPVVRQFFRLVVGPVSAWYPRHNTANPACPLPADVLVIEGDKFAN